MSIPLARSALSNISTLEAGRQQRSASPAESAGLAQTLAKGAAASRHPRPDLGPLLAVLYGMIEESRAVVVHVTSAAHQEGTTTVARDIAAAVAASQWCKVVLVDAHPARRTGREELPGMMEQFERGEEPVLMEEWLQGACIRTGAFCGAGRSMTRQDSVRGLYGYLRTVAQLVLVDCPPVLSGENTAMLGSAADGTILVVEAERTPAAEVLRAREILDQVGAATLGIVLNRQRRRIPKLIQRFL